MPGRMAARQRARKTLIGPRDAGQCAAATMTAPACSEQRAPSRGCLDRLIYEAAAGTPAAVIVAHSSRAARRIIAGTLPRKAISMLHTTLIAIDAAAGTACFAAGLAACRCEEGAGRPASLGVSNADPAPTALFTALLA